jgi:uncharacterized protein (DUF4415 family)
VIEIDAPDPKKDAINKARHEGQSLWLLREIEIATAITVAASSRSAMAKCAPSACAFRVPRKGKCMPRTMRNSTPDIDNPEWTEQEFRRARPLADVLEESKRRGRPPVAEPKVSMTIRIAPRVVNAYRASGKGWQSRVQQILEKHAPKVPKARRRSRSLKADTASVREP